MKKILLFLLFIPSLVFAQPGGGSGVHITSESQHPLRHRADRVIAETYKLNTGITVQAQLDNLADGLVISGSGDITKIGDCTTGDCFDGTSGTTLTFNNAGGDGALDYDGTDFTFDKPITATTLNTGQGANELYDMNQNVQTTDEPTFANVTVNDDAYSDSTWNNNNNVPTKNAVRDKIETLSFNESDTLYSVVTRGNIAGQNMIASGIVVTTGGGTASAVVVDTQYLEYSTGGAVSLRDNLALNNYYLSGDGGNEGIFIKSDGNVGIGTASPSAQLELSGATMKAISNTIDFTDVTDGFVLTFDTATNTWAGEVASGGAPTDADYLTGTANASLSAEIVAGTAPGGELGGTWASPTIDSTHSGSAHHSAVTLGAGNDSSLALSGQELTLTVAKDLVTTAPLTGGTDNILTGADADITIALTQLKDIVTTAPLTGGENDVLPGADADLTLAITVAKDIVAGVGLSGGEDNVLPGADADTTLTFDATELDVLTWDAGSLALIKWDWNLSAGDPAMTFGNNYVSVSTGNLGVGNTAPQGLLDVGTSPGTGLIVLGGGNVGIGTSNPIAPLHIASGPVVVLNGNMGIGTTAPTQVLEVNGAIYSSNSGNSWFQGNVGIGNTAPEAQLDVGTTPGTGLIVTTASNVGIGTTSPTQKLDVSGTANATTLTEGGNAVYNSTEVPGGELGGTWASPTIDDSLAVTSWTLTTPIFSGIVNTDNNWLSGDGGAEGLGIDDSGNVGIGITDPVGLLHVGSKSVAPLYVASSTGNVGIGTTAPARKLDIIGTIRTQDTMPFMVLTIYNPATDMDAIGKKMPKAVTLDKVYAQCPTVAQGTNTLFTLYVVGTDGTGPKTALTGVGQTASLNQLVISSFSNGGTVPSGQHLIVDIESTQSNTAPIFRLQVDGHES